MFPNRRGQKHLVRNTKAQWGSKKDSYTLVIEHTQTCDWTYLLTAMIVRVSNLIDIVSCDQVVMKAQTDSNGKQLL